MTQIHPDPLPAWTLRKTPDGHIDAIVVLSTQGQDHCYSFEQVDELFDTGAALLEAAITLKSARAVGEISPFLPVVDVEVEDGEVDLSDIGFRGTDDLDQQFRDFLDGEERDE